MTKADIDFVRFSVDCDDFMITYDVDGYANRVEYQYEIEAFTGRIIGFELDYYTS